MQGIYNFVFDRIQLNPLKLHFDKTAFMERTLEISRTGLILLRGLAGLSTLRHAFQISNRKLASPAVFILLLILASIIYISFDRRLMERP